MTRGLLYRSTRVLSLYSRSHIWRCIDDLPARLNERMSLLELICVSVGCLVLLVAVPSISPATERANPNLDVGVKLDDSVAAVQSSLHTDLQPEPMGDPFGTTMIHLRSKGIWVFFGKASRVSTIRLDRPYSGDVMGIKIGDRITSLISKLGAPIRQETVFSDKDTYVYAPDDTEYVQFDVANDIVQDIRLTK